jgi:hypothetical protein
MEFKWIIKGLVESAFVVASILMALAVDEWSQNREYAELADQSIGIFEREILRNQARLADAAPYHQGIRDLLSQVRMIPERDIDVRSVMEGLEAPVLLSTAWETALATGALTHMEFEVVSALSLTYSIQESFMSRGRLQKPRFASPEGLTFAQGRDQLEEAYEYVAALTRAESELLTVFDEAMALIAAHRGIDHSDEDHDTAGTKEPSPGR